MPWHSPDSKIETVLAEYFAQADGNELSGYVYQTRFDLTRGGANPEVRIVCDEIEEWQPGGEQTVEPSGNWTCAVSITLRTPVGRKDKAGQKQRHEQAVARIMDLIYETTFEAQLNEVATDHEVQVFQARVTGKQNELDDDTKRFSSMIEMNANVVPHVTGQ